jgi:xanthine dehydrogenase accessory factor
MLSSTLEVFAHALQWLQQEQDVVLVTVVKTKGATPRAVGAILAVREDGSMVGSVSGGCVEADIANQVQAKAFKHPTILIPPYLTMELLMNRVNK